MNTIEIRPRHGKSSKKISTGANTVVLLDGKPLRGCSRITVDICAAGVAKIN